MSKLQKGHWDILYCNKRLTFKNNMLLLYSSQTTNLGNMVVLPILFCHLWQKKHIIIKKFKWNGLSHNFVLRNIGQINLQDHPHSTEEHVEDPHSTLPIFASVTGTIPTYRVLTSLPTIAGTALISIDKPFQS